MFEITKVTPAIGVEVSGVDFSEGLPSATCDAIYQALLDHQVIFFRNTDISPAAHMAFAESFGELDQPHIHYPFVDGFDRIMLLENDADTPPDTNSWHTDLTFKANQPFASVLVARTVPEVGGDTLWSSTYAAYDRLPAGMKQDLEDLRAIHDYGDFRNSYAADLDGKTASERLTESAAKFGATIKPLIGSHPVTGRKFLNFNEAFVIHILGMTTGESNALKTYLAGHMNLPEDQLRWRWRAGDIAMWDNRVTMHYAVADYMPNYRCMNRITIVHDRRAGMAQAAE
ncbi:MAG: TauD/TfdA family dioxygenase [Pseudomonadota bacterium]